MSVYGSGLHAQHQAKLASSAISPDVARERGYTTADTRAQLEREGLAPAQRIPPALVIPLHNVLGERWGVQIRPDEPRMLKGKSIKYETAAGTKMALDVHPRVRPHLGDPQRPLVITEGPLKADAAVSAGLDAVALLGVWNWRGTNDKGGTVALSDLESIALKGRRVVVAFDSDVLFKRPVHDAMARLGALLDRRGAEVLYAYLPSGPAGAKQGLDDWLGAHTGPGPAADALWALCEPELRLLPSEYDGAAGVVQDEDTFDDVDEEPGAQLLDDVAALVAKYVALPSAHALVAVALWVAHTHAVNAAESTPRLAFLSPEMGSGKTRSLEVLELLAARALRAANLTAAALYRLIGARQPSVLIDEVDTIFGPNAADHEALRAILNAGHRRGSVVYRCVGEGANTEVADFPAFAAVALAGLGDLPATIADRSVVIRMRRRAPDEHVVPFRQRDAIIDAQPLHRRLAAWGKRNADDLEAARPTMPAGLTDRPADVWEPLLAIADRAGGAWPWKAREAAVFLLAEAQAEPATLGVKLLADTRTVFGDDEKLATKELVERLVHLEEAPWGDLRRRGDPTSKPLDPRGLAFRLRPYGIKPTTFRLGDATPKGYERADFYDAWQRYLEPDEATLAPPTPSTPSGAATSATPQREDAEGADVADIHPQHASQPQHRTPANMRDVADVADVAALRVWPRVKGERVADKSHPDRNTSATSAPSSATSAACHDCGAPSDAGQLHRRGCPQRPRAVAL